MTARLRFAKATAIDLGQTGKSCGFTNRRFFTSEWGAPEPFTTPVGVPGDLLLIIGHGLRQTDGVTSLSRPTGWTALTSGSPVWWRWATGGAADVVDGTTVRGLMAAGIRGAAPAGTASGTGGSPIFPVDSRLMWNRGPTWVADFTGRTIRDYYVAATADLLVGGLSILYALGSAHAVDGMRALHPGWPQPDASESDLRPNPYFAVMFNEPWYATREMPYCTMFAARPMESTTDPGPYFTGIGNTSFFESADINLVWLCIQPWWNAGSATVELDGAIVDVPLTGADLAPAAGDTIWIVQDGRRLQGVGYTPA